MHAFAASPFLDTLGWALLNSWWQFGILWLLYYLISTGFKNLTAAAKHSIAIYLLAAGACWFVINLSWKFYSYSLLAGETVTDSFAIRNTFYSNTYSAAHSFLNDIMPYWSVVYLICIIVLFIKFCFFIRNANTLQSTGVTKMPVDWRMYIRKTAQQLGIEKEVHAILSARIDTPQVIGYLKPVILVPLACLSNLSPEQIEAVLLHELVHIKRNDYFVNLFVATIEILFFFNPFVKQLIIAIRREREYSCDDMVLQFQYHPQHYAQALLTLEKNRVTPVTYGIAARGSGSKQLLIRIQRLVGMKRNEQQWKHASAYMMALTLLGFIAMVNPVKIVADKTIANKQLSLLRSKINYNKEGSFLLPLAQASAASHHTKKKLSPVENSILVTTKKANKTSESAPGNNEELITVTSPQENSQPENIQQAATTEVMAYSMPEYSGNTAPTPAETYSVTPYVPSNSFSYRYIPDSPSHAIKRETYDERKAREALEKTRKAIAEINWNQIARQLKCSPAQLAKLKAEMNRQLAQLNWKQINDAVQGLGNNDEIINKTADDFRKRQEVQKYLQQEAYYEALQKDISEKQQLIKLSEKREQEHRKTVIEEQNKLQAEMRKKRIIDI